MKKQSGQSLIEITVAFTLAAIVLGALIILVLTGLKNSQFAQNQGKATKYAQEAIDQIRNIRDMDEEIAGLASTYKFSDIWSIDPFNLDCEGSQPGRYFKIEVNSLIEVSCPLNTGHNIGSGLTRQILFQDGDNSDEKKVIVKVKWTDSSGEHESNLQTIITRM